MTRRFLAAWVLVGGSLGCTRGAAPAATPPAAASSVLVVTVDTLRADRLGCYGDARARTPVMDGLAREGVLFERAYTPVPITLPAHVSMMTGLLPPAHGVRGNGFVLDARWPTLAEALRARGWRTGAFVGAFPLARRFGLDRGFDHYDDAMGKAAGVHYEFSERPAAAVVAAARAWLAEQAGPVFLWVHLFDPHAPYAPPPEFAGEDPYRGEVASADAALRSLLDAWDARARPGLVALLSDHGEAFGEHGEESHSLFVYDTTLHVPFVLRGAGLPGGRRVRQAVGIASLAATVLEAAGAAPTLPGPSLLPLARGVETAPAALYAETLAPRLDFGWSDLRSWRHGRYKYIRAPRPELYDVEADPQEARNLAAEKAGDMAALSAQVDAVIATEQEARAPARPAAETAERLRALGYVQAPQTRRGSGVDPKDRVDVARRIARAAGPFADHRAAARAYAALARDAPEVPVVNLRLADALLRSGRAAEAVPYYRRVIAAGPRGADAHVGLATAYAESGRLDEARRTLEAGLEVDAGNGQLHYNLGEIARARGEREAARARYEAARRDPVTRERAERRLEELR